MKQLGTLLVDEEMLTQDQLDEALVEQKTTGAKLGAVLVKLGFVTEEALYYFLAIQTGLGFCQLDEKDLADDLVRSITAKVANEYKVIPINKVEGAITFATPDPSDPKLFRLREDMLLDSNTEILYEVSTESAIQEALKKYYGISSGGNGNGSGGADGDSMQDIVKSEDKLLSPEGLLDDDAGIDTGKSSEFDEFDENSADDAPVIRLVNSIISTSVANGASDIHLNPQEKTMIVRFRIDGKLISQPSPPPKYRRAMVARIKVMARLDIMDKRNAQDGRIKIKVQGRVIDLRVSTLPTIYGENVVMRILDQESLQLDLTKLGFEEAELAKYRLAITKPYGMVLHTGPTGSGKTTTLYSALENLNDPAKNLMTIEDPVEYNLPGVVQCQVNTEVGLTFAQILRANLRQDPNVIMVGEIRDGETAEIAVKAALTGHMVLSTLHTNDAPSTVMRLVDMGIDSMYVGTAVLIVVAQRLIRRICSECKEVYKPTEDEIIRLQLEPNELDGIELYRGKGCDNCRQSGYKGRVALYEIMVNDDVIQDKIFAGADLNELRDTAVAQGMMTLRQLAVYKWKKGVTTMEEVIRLTVSD